MCRSSLDLRDVSAGATGATAVAPKFSDTLTPSQPGGESRFCPPSQRSNLNFLRDYVPGSYCLIYKSTVYDSDFQFVLIPFLKKQMTSELFKSSEFCSPFHFGL